jgi:Fe-S-cluster containining protein
MRSTSRGRSPYDPLKEQRAQQLEELRGIYAQTDALFSGMSCDASTDCCRFGVTGREPYPTAIEIEALRRALAASGRKSATKSPTKNATKKRLPMADADERRCPMLSDEGRCIVYAARPFGCRTFFCDRSEGKEPSRQQVAELSRRIADLSARFHPADPGPRPLTRVDL